VRCGRELCPAGDSCCSASCGECGSACNGIATCEPDCGPMDARPQGESPGLLGWFWDGSGCVSHHARSCSGSSCEDAFMSQAECEAVFGACQDP
jgi:hypothetical protein